MQVESDLSDFIRFAFKLLLMTRYIKVALCSVNENNILRIFALNRIGGVNDFILAYFTLIIHLFFLSFASSIIITN